MYIINFIILTVVTVSGIFVVYFLLPHLLKIWLKSTQTARFKKTGRIYLTFDDGPHPAITPPLLKILQTYEVKATFFLLGKNAELYPELVKQILEHGHEIGEHSYRHTHPWKVWPWVSLQDIKQGSDILTGFKPDRSSRLYRPPYGKGNLLSLLYLFFLKKKIIYWNLDPEDYLQANGEEVANTLLKEDLIGSVILLHEERTDVVVKDNYQATIEGVRILLNKTEEYRHLYANISEGLGISVQNKNFVL